MTPDPKQILESWKALCDTGDSRRLAYGPSKLHNGLFYGGFVVGPDPSPDFTINKRAEFFELRDAEFYLFARTAMPALIEALEIAMDALQRDRGKTINPSNAMELFWRMSVRHMEAIERIEEILDAAKSHGGEG